MEISKTRRFDLFYDQPFKLLILLKEKGSMQYERQHLPGADKCRRSFWTVNALCHWDDIFPVAQSRWELIWGSFGRGALWRKKQKSYKTHIHANAGFISLIAVEISYIPLIIFDAIMSVVSDVKGKYKILLFLVKHLFLLIQLRFLCCNEINKKHLCQEKIKIFYSKPNIIFH